MNTHAQKTQENKSQLIASGVSQKQKSKGLTFQFMDNRSESIQMRELEKMSIASNQVNQLKTFQETANNYSKDLYYNSEIPTQTKSPIGQTNLVVQRQEIIDAHGEVINVPDDYVQQKGSAKYDVWGDPNDPGTHWSIAKVKGVKSHFTKSEGQLEKQANDWRSFQSSLGKKHK